MIGIMKIDENDFAESSDIWLENPEKQTYGNAQIEYYAGGPTGVSTKNMILMMKDLAIELNKRKK